MKQYIIEANNFNGVESFYDEITRVFHLPAYFGRNLDALYDVLSDKNESIELIWKDSTKSKKDFQTDSTQPGFYGQVVKTLRDVENLELLLK